MRAPLILIAVLAISWTVPAFAASSRFARDVESPQVDGKTFLEEADILLRDVLTNYTGLTSNIFNYDIFVSGSLKSIKDELKNISYFASLIAAQNTNDVELQHAAQQIRGAGGLLRLGVDAVIFQNNVGYWKTKLDDDYIEVWHDDEELIVLSTLRESLFSYKDFPEFDYYWQRWMTRTSRTYFFDFVVKIIQTFAKEYNMTAAEFWYPNYSEQIMAELEGVMQQLRPLYEKLHAFVRSDLFKIYGAGVLKPKGPIPYHLFQRTMHTAWKYETKSSGDIFEYVLPNYADALKEANFTTANLLQTADEFYRNLGFDAIPEKVWESNIFEADECPGFVTDNSMNTTLEYCGHKTPGFEDYAEIHALMGRLHTALLKKQLPAYYFEGYNLGTPVGNAVKLAATSPKHLEFLHLVSQEDEFSEDVYLLRNFYMAIEQLFSIPIAYVEARVVVDFLNEKVKKSELNQLYWTLLEQYAGVEPWADREELSHDLPLSVFLGLNKQTNVINVVRDKILGFEFYKAFCQQSGYVGSLDNCDFSGVKGVGVDLKEMLALGSSKPFNEVVAKFLQKFDGSAILDYFKPTEKWLDRWIKATNISVGWEHTTKKLNKELFRNKEYIDAFLENSSASIYQLYDKIASELFAEEDKKEEKDDYGDYEYDYPADFQAKFWKHSDSAVAASALKDIALVAQQIDTSILTTSKRKAVERLCKVSDIFVLGEEMEDLAASKKQLAELVTDKDIERYKYNKTSGEDEDIALADIRNIILHSRDPNELKYYWEAWRKRNSNWAEYTFLVALKKIEKAAELLGQPTDEFWFKQYNPSILETMEEVIKELQPLYKNLHSYVKKALSDRYGYEHFSKLNGAIPDHLLEQVLLQIWTNESIVEKHFPFADLPPTDQAVDEQQHSALQLLQKAEDFYTSLGFEPIEEDFWQHRLRVQGGVENQTDCHATIYDMTPKVYMKYCEKVSYKKLLQAHGYMGRLHYAVEKHDLPYYYFDSYFLEYPVGEAVILSASSPTHLQKMGLMPNFKFTDEVRMNRLIRMGIHTLFKLHKYFVHTLVVTEHLQGKIAFDDINKYYWKYMVKYAGIEPPSDRSFEDFDFSADFYTDLEQNHQMKKLISEVLGYSIYNALCQLSDHEGDLMDCDFYGSKNSGTALKKMMKLGSSKSRLRVLRSIELYSGLTASDLNRYYDPLSVWLQNHSFYKKKNYNVSGRKYTTGELLDPQAKEKDE